MEYTENQSTNGDYNPIYNNKRNGETKTTNSSITPLLVFSVISAALGSSFEFGYNLGCVNAPGKLISNWDKELHANEHISDNALELRWSIAVGIFAFGGMFGALASGYLADKFGRKTTLIYNNAFGLLGAALMTIAKPLGFYHFITIGRFVVGFYSGLGTGLAPMYMMEISPENLRGSVGSVHQLMITIGVLVSELLGLPIIFGTARLWPFVFAFVAVPSIMQLLTLPFCPESPKYSTVIKSRPKVAEEDMNRLRKSSKEVAEEMPKINEEATVAKNEPEIRVKDVAFGEEYRWRLFVSIVMMLSQQFCGMNAALFYSSKIFETAGLKGDGPAYATIGIGLVLVLQTLISIWLVDHPRFGRRFLHLVGLSGMFVSSILIVIALTLAESKNPTLSTIGAYASIFFVLTFVISFATGPGSIPWFFVSELFPSNVRAIASSIAVTFNWLANFIVGTSFLPLNSLIKQYTFLIFTAFLALFIWFTYKFVPETKGKSIEQIEAEMKKK